MTGSDSSNPNLEFLNSLSGILRIDVDLSDPEEAKIVDVQLEASVLENEQFRDLTEDELQRVVFQEPCILLRGESGDVIEHTAPDGESFTVQELLDAVEETERRTRGNSEWFGGIDVHHVFFERIYRRDEDVANDVWSIFWGS